MYVYPLSKGEDMIVRWICRIGPAVSLAMLGTCLLAGCATELKNQGEVGIRYGHEITFFSRAAKTSDEAATSALTVDKTLWQPIEAPKAEGDE